MPKSWFEQLNSVSFLQAFIIQSAEIGNTIGCSGCTSFGNYVEQVGLSASHYFEAGFRDQFEIDGDLDQNTYADIIVGLKNKIGGSFSRMSSEPGVTRVRSTKCPFGDQVRKSPELCKMTSSVFGGIAARNFGYAKVVLDKRIATGDECCQVSIYVDESTASEIEGDEYHRHKGKVRAVSGSSEVSERIAKKMDRMWLETVKSDSAVGRRPLLVSTSPAMCDALATVDVIGPTTASALITGETGVGKEVIARAIHAVSKRWNKRFEAVNCGAIPEGLVESVLFGHERGAFTGAYEVHHGLFERADGGTLFLDEVDSLPLPAQVRLLRVLQEGEYMRVGGKQAMISNARIIAATSKPLKDLVLKGFFREDLFYRLNVVPINLPPLCERPEDIPDLIKHILAKLSDRHGKTVTGVSQSILFNAMAYRWPGNVRELENVLERSFLFCTGSVLETLLLDNSDGGVHKTGIANHDNATCTLSLKEAKKRASDIVEISMLKENLERLNGNVHETARKLGLTPRAVHQKLNAHRIDPAAYREKASFDLHTKHLKHDRTLVPSLKN